MESKLRELKDLVESAKKSRALSNPATVKNIRAKFASLENNDGELLVEIFKNAATNTEDNVYESLLSVILSGSQNADFFSADMNEARWTKMINNVIYHSSSVESLTKTFEKSNSLGKIFIGFIEDSKIQINNGNNYQQNFFLIKKTVIEGFVDELTKKLKAVENSTQEVKDKILVDVVREIYEEEDKLSSQYKSVIISAVIDKMMRARGAGVEYELFRSLFVGKWDNGYDNKGNLLPITQDGEGSIWKMLKREVYLKYKIIGGQKVVDVDATNVFFEKVTAIHNAMFENNPATFFSLASDGSPQARNRVVNSMGDLGTTPLINSNYIHFYELVTTNNTKNDNQQLRTLDDISKMQEEQRAQREKEAKESRDKANASSSVSNSTVQKVAINSDVQKVSEPLSLQIRSTAINSSNNVGINLKEILDKYFDDELIFQDVERALEKATLKEVKELFLNNTEFMNEIAENSEGSELTSKIISILRERKFSEKLSMGDTKVVFRDFLNKANTIQYSGSVSGRESSTASWVKSVGGRARNDLGLDEEGSDISIISDSDRGTASPIINLDRRAMPLRSNNNKPEKSAPTSK